MGAPPAKLYDVQLAELLAATGQKVDSSHDHPSRVMGKGDKPEMGDDDNWIIVHLQAPAVRLRFAEAELAKGNEI